MILSNLKNIRKKTEKGREANMQRKKQPCLTEIERSTERERTKEKKSPS